MNKSRAVSIFPLIISVPVLVVLFSSCQTYLCKNDKYINLLNEKLENERKQKILVERLQRENTYTNKINLKISKDKELLKINLTQTKGAYKDYKDKSERREKELAENMKKLQERIDILKLKEKAKVGKLIALHRKQKEEMQENYRKEKEELEKKLKDLSNFYNENRKRWTNDEFFYKKELNDKKEKIKELRTALVSLEKERLESERVLAEFFQLVSDEFVGKIIAKESIKVIIAKRLILISNDLLFQKDGIDWKDDGRRKLEKILERIQNFSEIDKRFQVFVFVSIDETWLTKDHSQDKERPIDFMGQFGPPPLNLKNSQKISPSQDHLASTVYFDMELDRYPYPYALALLRAYLISHSFSSSFKIKVNAFHPEKGEKNIFAPYGYTAIHFQLRPVLGKKHGSKENSILDSPDKISDQDKKNQN